MKNNYYVYSHNKLSDGKCFYIGICKGNRVYSLTHRNLFYNQILQSEQGFKWRILVSGISKKKALKLEKNFISQIGIKHLTNIVGDGKGNSGSYVKEQTAWNKGLKNCQPYSFLKVKVDGVEYNSVNEAIKELGIGKSTFYRWRKKGRVETMYRYKSKN